MKGLFCSLDFNARKIMQLAALETVSELMGNNPRLTVTALQTVGSKGWDGFSIARVND